jgi:hypothetical protein
MPQNRAPVEAVALRLADHGAMLVSLSWGLPTMSDDADKGFIPYLRMLTYPIIFVATPSERVEEAFRIMARDAPEHIPDAFIRAIDQGLKSQVKLSELTEMHSEEAIRSYLLAMRDRLQRA